MKSHYIFAAILAGCLFIRLFFTLLQAQTYHDGEHVQFTTTLLADPQEQGKFTTIAVFLPGTFPPRSLRIVLPKDIQLRYGDTIVVSGNIKEKMLNNKKTILISYFPQIEAKKDISLQILAPVYFIRQKITGLFHSSVDATSASLFLGIVFGIKQNLPRTFAKELQQTGLTHVIAASGMNVTMVASFVMGLLGYFFRRRLAIMIAIFVILFYALLSGLQASIVRASMMSIFAFSGQLFGRQYSGWYGLLLIGCVMVFISPSLLFDIGFQLSFLSTAGILSIKPLIPITKILSDDIATTLAAQIATLPVLLVYFGQYSLLSVLVNALVLWTIPILMVIGGAGALLGLLIAPLGKLLLFLALPLLWYFEILVRFFGNLHINVQINSVPLVFTAGYYCLVISVIMIISKKEI